MTNRYAELSPITQEAIDAIINQIASSPDIFNAGLMHNLQVYTRSVEHVMEYGTPGHPWVSMVEAAASLRSVYCLRRYRLALEAYDEMIKRDPDDNLSGATDALKAVQESLQAWRAARDDAYDWYPGLPIALSPNS